MLKNKKGFTLIELIIVVAIMAVLVALLAPNVLKYLEKSKVGKDINTLDSVRLAIEAELMDENMYLIKTDKPDTPNVIEGNTLRHLKDDADAPQDGKLLASKLFGSNGVLDNSFATDKIFVSTTAKNCSIKIFLDGKGGVAVAAVSTSSQKIVSYDGKMLLVSTKFSDADIAKLECM